MNVPTVIPAPGRAVSPETPGKGASSGAEGFATLMGRHLGGQDATDETAQSVAAAAGAPLTGTEGLPSLVVPLSLAGGEPTGTAEEPAVPSDAEDADSTVPGLLGADGAALAAPAAAATVVVAAPEGGTANAGGTASQTQAAPSGQTGTQPGAPTPGASPTTTPATGAVAGTAAAAGDATSAPVPTMAVAGAAGARGDRSTEAPGATTAATSDAGAMTTPTPTAGAGGAATTSTASAGTPGSAVTGQVFPQIPALLGRGEGRHSITLRLHPADLGEVRVTVTVKNGAVDVTLAAGAEARQALRAGSADLRSLLEMAGAATGQVVIRDLPSTPQVQPSGSTAFSMAGDGRGDGATAEGDADPTAGDGGSENDGRGGPTHTSGARSERGPTASHPDQTLTARSTGTPAALDLTL